MARSATLKRSSGGFLNNVDVTLVDYTFTDEFNGEPFVPGKIASWDGKGKIDKPHNLNAFVTWLVDGAEAPITQNLRVGNFNDWEIEDDGKTIRPIEGASLNAGTAFGTLLASIEEAGYPCENDQYEEGVLNYEPLLGVRMRLVQRVNEERNQKFGKKKDKKTGKEYNRTELVAEAVYGPSTPQKAVGGTKAVAKGNTAKMATNGSGKVLGGAKGKQAPVVEEVDIEAVTAETLVAVVQRQKAKDGVHSLTKAKLGMPVMTDVRKAYPGEDQIGKDAYKLVLDETFLKQELGWSYDHVTQMVSVEAA